DRVAGVGLAAALGVGRGEYVGRALGARSVADLGDVAEAGGRAALGAGRRHARDARAGAVAGVGRVAGVAARRSALDVVGRVGAAGLAAADGRAVGVTVVADLARVDHAVAAGR